MRIRRRRVHGKNQKSYCDADAAQWLCDWRDRTIKRAHMARRAVDACGIAVRLFFLSATAIGIASLRRKVLAAFPFVVVLDLMWALSPFLLLLHIGFGLALAATAPLLLLAFGQRTLALMFSPRASG